MSDKINNGGPAFPLPPVSHDGKVVALTEGVATGMTLRDYFAAKAMKSLVSEKILPDTVAKWSYEQADAMLRARDNRQDASS